MSANRGGGKRTGPIHVGEVVGRVIDPATARRGLVTAELLSAWADIAGPAHAAHTAPERIVWRRRSSNNDTADPGTLVMRVDGPRAVFVQHELPQIIERINAFFGYAAIDKVRLVQAPVVRSSPPAARPDELSKGEAGRLEQDLVGVDDEELRNALRRLGRGVLTRRRRD